MKGLFNCVSFLFLGPHQHPYPQDKIGICYQVNCIRKAWHSKSFGLFRFFILILEFSPFIFPTLYIQQCLRKRKRNCVDIISDVWVVVRIAALFTCLLWLDSRHSWSVTLVALYFIADIFFYVARVVFLTNTRGPTLSNERSLLFLVLNYGEIILAFAVLHYVWGSLKVEPLCPTQALYFSAVTSTTLGYGDVVPVTLGAQKRVIFQLAVNFVFIPAFIGAILNRFGNPLKKEN